MTERSYAIEALIETFQEHADHVEKLPIPDSGKDSDFNLPRALETICREIKYLQEITDAR